jgi:hypothetical protein
LIGRHEHKLAGGFYSNSVRVSAHDSFWRTDAQSHYVIRLTHKNWPVSQNPFAMTTFRLISLPVHGLLELACGLVVMAAPFALGFGAAGIVSGVVLGALIAGMALSTAPGDRGGVPVAAHFAFDRALVIALLGAALLLTSIPDRGAAVFFALAALAQLGLSLTTRYTATA